MDLHQINLISRRAVLGPLPPLITELVEENQSNYLEKHAPNWQPYPSKTQ
jgi:hypothetical protein